MIIIGPKATLGSEFIIVRNGSTILANILNSYKIIAMINPNEIPSINAIIVSYMVVKMCENKL